MRTNVAEVMVGWAEADAAVVCAILLALIAKSRFTKHRLLRTCSYGRGAGVGRTLGWGLDLGLGVGRGVVVGVAVTVGVGVALAVGVGVGVELAVGVGVGVPFPVGAWIATIMGEPVLK